MSLSPRNRDLAGNAAGYAFLPIFFPRNLNVTRADLRVLPNHARSRTIVPRGGDGVLIPIDSAGRSLHPNGAGAEAASAGGPVLAPGRTSPVPGRGNGGNGIGQPG